MLLQFVVVMSWGFISHLIGRKTINILEIILGIHGFPGLSVILMARLELKPVAMSGKIVKFTFWQLTTSPPLT